MSNFTARDLNVMQELLAREDRIPADDPKAQTRHQHVEHCLHQLVRFANLAHSRSIWRATQFGLNLGRAQELLGSQGGVNCWWRSYELLIEEKNYRGVMQIALQTIRELGLAAPTVEFINKL